MRKILTLIAAICLLSCTDQSRAKYYGGEAKIDIQDGMELVNVTWKDESDIWFLLRKRQPGEKADTLYFHQDKDRVIGSLTGNGTLILIEH